MSISEPADETACGMQDGGQRRGWQKVNLAKSRPGRGIRGIYPSRRPIHHPWVASKALNMVNGHRRLLQGTLPWADW